MDRLGASEFLSTCDQPIEALTLREQKLAIATIAGIQAVALALGIDVAANQHDYFSKEAIIECERLCIETIQPLVLPAPKPTDIPKAPIAKHSTPQPRPVHSAAKPSEKPKPKTQEIPEWPLRHMSYDQFERNAGLYIKQLPSLLEITDFPDSLSEQSAHKQLAYIAELNGSVQVTPVDFQRFSINREYNTLFRGVGSYDQKILPKFFIVHWTAEDYGTPQKLAASMSKSQKRIDYYIDREATTFQLFESDRNKPAHALNMNAMSQGVEIEAGGMMDYTQTQIEQVIMLAVDFCRRNNLEVSEKTILGHYAADLIFTNPYYHPRTGRFAYKSIHKFDPPQELMQIIVAKAKALDKALGSRH